MAAWWGIRLTGQITVLWGASSVGRALRSQRRGRGFNSPALHQKVLPVITYLSHRHPHINADNLEAIDTRFQKPSGRLKIPFIDFLGFLSHPLRCPKTNHCERSSVKVKQEDLCRAVLQPL